MKAYMGQCSSRARTREIQMLGVGEMTLRGQLPPRRFPWAYDNGAYRDYVREEVFDADAFAADLEWIAHLPPPDFVVAPDRVGAGAASLALSLEWLPRLERVAPVYLAVQDGMTPEGVGRDRRGFAGIFLGGTRRWKRRTLHAWAAAARSWGIQCHVGRASTPGFLDRCFAERCDSVDTCQPLWSHDKLRAWITAFRTAPNQTRLWDADGC